MPIVPANPVVDAGGTGQHLEDFALAAVAADPLRLDMQSVSGLALDITRSCDFSVVELGA